MPELKCEGCTRQEELGCEAKLIRRGDPKKGEADVWHKPAWLPIGFNGEEEWFACPRQHLKENSQFWSRLLMFYGLFKQGFLPEDGGVMRQSNRLLQLFQILDYANAQCDEQEAAIRNRPPGPPANLRRGA